MDIQSIIFILTSVVTGASIILRAIAPLTKTNVDNKILAFIEKLLKAFSLNVEEGKTKIEILIRNKD